jgi:hypothetical protein
MVYAFPADLADEITTRWKTLAEHHRGHAPALPRPAQLRHILETAFFASLEREEGRNLHFVLCCAPDITVLRDGLGETVPVVPLRVARATTVESIRALAPALSPQNAAMLVRCPPADDRAEACEIAGILHVGSHLARARSGRSFYHRPAPAAFVVDVRDAGEIHIYLGGIKLAALNGGRLQDQIAFSSLEFLPIAHILARGEQTLRPSITVPEHEPTREWSDFQWTALLNTVLCIINGVKDHEHGGTVLLVSPQSESSLPIRIKFELDEQAHVLGERFVRFLNARHRLAAVRWRARVTAGGIPDDQGASASLESETFAAEVDLADAADLVARLTAVDGAVVIGSDLRVLGFGAEIVLDAAAPIQAFEVIGNNYLPSQWPPVDSESFGMRHRSALRCVGVADQTAAFVVSQDGSVSLFWKQGGKVLLKRNVNTANPNMGG